MSERDHLLTAKDIIESAEALAVVSAFATGETSSSLEAAKHMPEYRELILAYGKYCITALRDSSVASFIENLVLVNNASIDPPNLSYINIFC